MLELAQELTDRGHEVILGYYQATSENYGIDFCRSNLKRAYLKYWIHSFKTAKENWKLLLRRWYASDLICFKTSCYIDFALQHKRGWFNL